MNANGTLIDDPARLPRVGYIGRIVPRELIEAAGLHPVRVSGQGFTVTPEVHRWWGARRRATADAIADAILERLLTHSLDGLDLLVVPHTTKAIEGIATAVRVLSEEGHGGLPPVHVLDRSYIDSSEAHDFNRRQLDQLASRLSGLGTSITAESLRTSTEAQRRLDEVKLDLQSRRIAEGSVLSGASVAQALLETWSMSASEATRFLEAFRFEETAAHRPRVFLAGSEVDIPDWHRAIEAQGGRVIGEATGWDPAPRVESADDAYAELSRRFAASSVDGVGSPMRVRIDAIVEQARAARPDVVVLAVRSNDGLATWEVPAIRRRLEDIGIRTVHLRDQPYTPDPLTDFGIDTAPTTKDER